MHHRIVRSTLLTQDTQADIEGRNVTRQDLSVDGAVEPYGQSGASGTSRRKYRRATPMLRVPSHPYQNVSITWL